MIFAMYIFYAWLGSALTETCRLVKRREPLHRSQIWFACVVCGVATTFFVVLAIRQSPSFETAIIAVSLNGVLRLVQNAIANRNKKFEPPVNASFLLYLFYDAQNCDALVGDLEERYRLIRKRFGTRRANFWYWTQVLRSLAPLGWAATKRLLKAASGVAALVEMWRRIRS